jgi:hypothetical protein
MKRTFYILAITAFISGIAIVGCKSNSDKKENAIENVNEANEDLRVVEEDQVEDERIKANDEEWQAFKAESNKTIADNENRILELKKAKNKPGQSFDQSYAKSIDALQERNSALKKRIADYENNQTNWESFKREFNSDAEGVANAFRDLNLNNKK